MNKKILISTSSFGEFDQKPLRKLVKDGFDCVLNPHGRKLTADETVQLAQNTVGIIAGLEDYSADVLKKLPNLKVISRCGVGVDSIDLKFAEKQGIKVFNTPNCLTQSVAELTVGLVLDLLRNVTLMDRAMRTGKWKKQMGSLLAGKNVGIVGFGRIGQRVSGLLMPFGVSLAYYDPYPQKHEAIAVKSLDDLLLWADIVLIHASSTGEENKPMFMKKQIQLMKKGSFLVNVARGTAIDEEALYQALKDKHLAGAALDVFQQEPYKGPLLELDHVILTPHIGSYAKEARIEMENEAVDNLLKAISN